MKLKSNENRHGSSFFAMKRVPAALILMAILSGLQLAHPQTLAPAALRGRVRSDAEGLMEGVLVTARRPESSISVTVVSNSTGEYFFPAGKLRAGEYHLSIRSAGYELAGPVAVKVENGTTARVDLKLIKTRNLASQLTSADWLLSVPGTPDQKNSLYRCAACHSLTPVVESAYNAKGWLATLVRMIKYSGQSVTSSPIELPFNFAVKPSPSLASYLSTINLSAKKHWDYELKVLPRPRGEATKVIITEYDLPGARSLPHDAILDKAGIVWFNDFQQPLIGRLDPRTGKVKEWRFPPIKPNLPLGTLSIKFDREGYLWIARFRQGGITRFDPRTQGFKTWRVPPRYDNDRADTSHVAPAPDGTVWFSDSEMRLMYRLDPRTGQMRASQSFPDYNPAETADVYGHGMKPVGHRTYGIAVDSKGNGYFADILGGNIGRVDAKTGKATLFKTPTLNSGPRRMYMDSEDRLWFGENYGNKVGMFDTRTEQFKEWSPTTPWSGPYPAMSDRNGEVWTGGMSTDFIYRLDPRTGRFIEYLLPTLEANIRRINVDNSTHPVTVWVAEVHHGKIAKIEPLQ